MLSPRLQLAWAALATTMSLAGCGGGGGSDATAPPPAPAPPPAVGPTANSVAAATATAQQNPLCSQTRLGPYRWEIGDASGALVSGAFGDVTASTRMSVASASKWVYGAYVVQKRGGVGALNATTDLPYLHFTSGYTDLGNLSSALVCGDSSVQTVDQCLNATPTSGQPVASTVGKFDYDSGHMQKHASLMGLGSFDSAALGTEVSGTLGLSIGYGQPLLAGGVYTTPDGYAAFLRGILAGRLQMHEALGANAVCTNPLDSAHGCSSANAIVGPIPTTESWHYAIGHWVEDDSVVGDGAFSSAGAFGFYPWIDAGKTWYGVIARQQEGEKQGYASAQCGRLIRKAWMTGVQQTGETPL